MAKKEIINIKNPIKKTKSCEDATCRVSIRENKNNIVNVKFMRFYKNLTSNKCKNNQFNLKFMYRNSIKELINNIKGKLLITK